MAVADAEPMQDAMTMVRDHSFSYWDALLLSTSRRAGCAYMLSKDMQDGRNIAGLTIIDPFGPKADALIELL
jgi:predicted nucleic acid-binding protein